MSFGIGFLVFIIEKLGEVSKEIMNEIKTALKVTFDLES